MKKHIFNNEKEMKAFAKKFAKTLKGGDTIALIGDLGAGKTTFVKGLAEAFGIEEEISSPTFVYMHVHRLDVKGQKSKVKSAAPLLVHVDAYRGNALVMREIGLEEYLGDPDAVVVIEWADRLEELLPEGAAVLRFAHEGGDRRTISYRP